MERTLGGRAERNCSAGEGTVEANGYEPDPLAGIDESVDRLASGADPRSHEHDDPLGIGSAVVFGEAVRRVPFVVRESPWSPARSRARRGNRGWTLREPGRRRLDSAPCPSRRECRGSFPARRNSITSSSSMRAAMSSAESRQSSPAHGRSGTRRRSGGMARATSKWRRGRSGRSRGPPGLSWPPAWQNRSSWHA